MSRRSSIYDRRGPSREGRTIVVQDGRILGTLDEGGELVQLPEPPADPPSEWPQSWWQPVAEIEHWR